MLLDSQSPNNYLVGGSVRDFITNQQSKDFDVVTDIPMDIVEALFSQNGWNVDSVGKQFLVMVVSKNSEQFEISNFRKDVGFSVCEPRHSGQRRSQRGFSKSFI